MPIASPIQNNTNAGEISPLLEGRVDLRSYTNGLKRCLNFIPLAQGPISRRPGTMYVSAPKFNTKYARLQRFEYNTTQAYIIEVGDLYFRFFRNEGRLENPVGTPVEVVTPYPEADLPLLSFNQDADSLYISHNKYPQEKMIRNSSVSWTISKLAFLDGPYLPTNKTPTTITASGTTGSVTLTASAAIFAATDVNRAVRHQFASTWGWLIITAFTSTTQVTATVQSALGGTTAVTTWRLGLWSDTTGYPTCSVFYGDRLYYGGTTSFPDRLDGSVVGDYLNYAPSDTAGVVTDASAVSFTLNSSTVNTIYWLVGAEKGLVAGTAGTEWVIRPSTLGEALTPTNVNAVNSTRYGSKQIAPVRAGKSVLFLQRAGRKIRDFVYNYIDDGFDATDVTILSEHITVGGIVEMAYQSEPQSVVWMARADGTLVSLTYEKAQEVFGFGRHRLGGDPAITDIYSAAYSSVQSVACIPAPDGNSDQVWFLAARQLGGSVQKSIEFLTPLYVDSDDVGERFFVDMGAIYQGSPATVISGLSWFPNGTTVSVLADGAVHPNCVVTGGAITLIRPASTVHVGLGFLSEMLTMRINAGAATGTPQGKIKRIHKMVVLLFQTLGMKYGPDPDGKLDTYVFRKTSDPMGSAPPYLDDLTRDILWNDGYNKSGRMYFRQDQPLPMTILALLPTLATEG